MSLKARIDEDIRNAMKAKDQAALRALRAIKSAILLGESAEGREPGPLGVEDENALLMKQAKQRRDSIEQFRTNSREDLAVKEEEELRVIEKFLPKQLSAEELKEELKTIVAETGASGAKDIGKVMGMAMKKLSGKADGKMIAQIAKELLGS